MVKKCSKNSCLVFNSFPPSYHFLIEMPYTVWRPATHGTARYTYRELIRTALAGMAFGILVKCGAAMVGDTAPVIISFLLYIHGSPFRHGKARPESGWVNARSLYLDFGDTILFLRP